MTYMEHVNDITDATEKYRKLYLPVIQKSATLERKL